MEGIEKWNELEFSWLFEFINNFFSLIPKNWLVRPAWQRLFYVFMCMNVVLFVCLQVFNRLWYPIVRQGALVVLSHMLLSFQHSPEAFHLVRPLWTLLLFLLFFKKNLVLKPLVPLDCPINKCSKPN